MRVLTAVLVVAIMVAGCGSGSSGATSTKATGPYAFENKPWVLEEGIPNADHAPPTATFNRGRVTGFNGCNTYNASYKATATTLTIGQIAGTLMACTPPGDEVERGFNKALAQVRKWKVSQGKLTLSNASGQQLLKMGEATVTGDWTVTSLQFNDALRSPIPGTEITANFGSNGELTGSGGCNNYSTTYTTNGSQLTIKPIAGTQKHCADPAGVSDQEASYFAALDSATNFKLSGDQLALFRDDGTYAVSYVRR